MYLKLHNYEFLQCFGSGPPLLDPGARYGNWPKLKNKPDDQPFLMAFVAT
jgi:hypothetical protein